LVAAFGGQAARDYSPEMVFGRTVADRFALGRDRHYALICNGIER